MSLEPLKINLINTEHKQITITFNRSWDQEDIDTLGQLVLGKITQHKIKEKVLGADRENIRFSWQQEEFLLNFDCYSQSCWIDANTPNSLDNISQLSDLLTKPTE